MAFLVAENISKTFQNHQALSNVSLSMPEGSIFGLLGPNGAGKTTFIRIINQIITADSGHVHIRGERLSPKHTDIIGYLPEERGLYKKMKVGEQALYLSRLKGLNEAEAKKRLRHWFEKFEIADWWDKKVEELSKGMQQKIQFIVTILHEPSLLIFDEPFSGFDPINTNLLKNEILKLREKGATIIFSTHNMESVEEICDRIALINRSKLILEGPVNEIKSRYRQNIFEVEYMPYSKGLDEVLPADFQLIEKQSTTWGKLARIKIPSEADTNKLLQLLMNNARIISFKELIPTMNEIFIKTVSENRMS